MESAINNQQNADYTAQTANGMIQELMQSMLSMVSGYKCREYRPQAQYVHTAGSTANNSAGRLPACEKKRAGAAGPVDAFRTFIFQYQLALVAVIRQNLKHN